MHIGSKEEVMSATATDWIDLADRAGDGLEVTLLWSRLTGSVKVTVHHVASGRRFELDAPGAQALAAFYHPFAFAAARGIADRDFARNPIHA
jgi:hypothetical protein